MSNLVEKLIAGASALAIVSSVVGYYVSNGQAADPDALQIAVDKNGKLSVPDVDYRKDWVALGSWAVAAEEGILGSEGMHVVYTQPGTVEAFRKTGKFPDGAVLIKELFSTSTNDMTTGTVSSAHETSGWFVMVKDKKDRFPDNKLWGDGWGWSYFDAKDRNNSTSKNYKNDCLGCHIPAKDQDWVYVQGYPVLKSR